MRVFGLLRVSKATNGSSLAAQRAAIEAEAELRGWEIADWVEETVSGSGRKARPKLEQALAELAAGKAEAIVVSKLDRLSRSMLDFAKLMADAKKQGWRVIALNVNVDTSTPAGKMLVNNVMSAAEFEREMIGERTRDALAVKRAEGVKLGRPRQLPDDVVAKIKRWRKDGATLQAIADRLNEQGVPTAHSGKPWGTSSVDAVLKRADQRVRRQPQAAVAVQRRRRVKQDA